MTYQALARKWRPHRFDELVGQAHVVKALSNALDQGRVHHAFLFTGTRGVGKTTVARILAKCLNCEQGVSSTPCGECATCREIDEGRHPDLIEVDAASRAKVDETRDLMNNVQYAPTRGRHKVYLIDEVHMFSDASFNALLKTLEEPPPHVKFLLATTDPQRMPVTVLSRCLQFSLKRLPAEQIAARLEQILTAEAIPFESPALRLVARAADGSLRDALSLLDQAIAHGAGQVQAEPVRTMLGLLDRGHVHALVERLADADGAGLLAQVEAMSGEVADFGEALAELLAALKEIAVAQAVPGVGDGEDESRWAQDMAGRLPAEDVQLYYQIGLIGRRDLPLAPDPRTGFEMTLLRMLAFAPETGGTASVTPGRGGRGDPAPRTRDRAPAPARGEAPAAPARDEVSAAPARDDMAAARSGDQMSRVPAAADSSAPLALAGTSSVPASSGTPPVRRQEEPAPPEPLETPPKTVAAVLDFPGTRPAAPGADAAGAGQWASMAAELGLTGLARELASNCEFVAMDEQKVTLRLAPEQRQLAAGRGPARLEKALTAYLGRAVKLDLQVAQRVADTPAEITRRRDEKRRAEAARTLENDPGVAAILDAFDGSIEPESVRPLD